MNETPRPDSQGAKEYFRNKITYTTGPVELSRMLEAGEDVVVIDVREAEDYAKGHIAGSINLPHDDWPSRGGLRKDRTNIVLCYSHVCHLAAKACFEFASDGYPVMEMDGGFKAWKEHDLKIEKGQPSGAPRATTLKHSTPRM